MFSTLLLTSNGIQQGGHYILLHGKERRFMLTWLFYNDLQMLSNIIYYENEVVILKIYNYF